MQRGGSRSDRERIKIEQTRVPGQLLQSGEGDGGEASANVRQGESSCAIQAKLDAILRNSTSQDRPVTDRTQGNRVVFVEPQRNKRESTPLPLTRGATSIDPGGPRQLLKVGPQLRKMARGIPQQAIMWDLMP